MDGAVGSTCLTPASRRPAVLTGTLIVVLSVGLNGSGVFSPQIFIDDFQFCVKSLTWEAAQANLWTPANEHAMPLGRISTCLLLATTDRQDLFPIITALQGMMAQVASLLLLFVFVRRELGSVFHGLLAMSLFGVTSVYHQAVVWFAASFSVVALDFILLALLAAQAWRQTGSGRHLLWATVWCTLAPAWFASGVLAGVLCLVYLITSQQQTSYRHLDAPQVVRACFPCLGTVLFLVISIPRTAAQIMHLPHYQGQTALQVLDPGRGLLYTLRSIVDNLCLGTIGVFGVECPVPLVIVIWIVLGVVLRWLWRNSPRRGLVGLGCGLIFLSYWLVYSARAAWGYEGLMTGVNWARYHLLPQVGLSLLISCGIAARKLASTEMCGSLTRGEAAVLCLISAALFAVSLPRSLFAAFAPSEEQQAVLRRIEEMDRRCRKHGIDARTARAVLGSLVVPNCQEGDNGWDWLRGAAKPRPLTLDEARYLMEETSRP